MTRGGPGTAEFSQRFDDLNGELPAWLERAGLALGLVACVGPAAAAVLVLSWLGAPELLVVLGAVAVLIAGVAVVARVAPRLRGWLVLRLRHRRRRELARQNRTRRQGTVLRPQHVAPTPGVRGRRP